MKDFNKYFIVGTNSDALHDTMNGTVTGELIRCRECKYFNRIDTWRITKTKTVSAPSCRYGLSTKPGGYCHRAERNRNDE